MDKATQWKKLLLEYRSGDKSVEEFCSERGLSTHTFRYWQARLREPRRSFVKIGEAKRIELILPSGSKLLIPADLSSDALKQIFEAADALTR
jgi:hypothetical protein